MDHESLYETIFARKSVRTYAIERLDEKTLESVRSVATELAPLFPEIRVELRIVESNQVRGMFKVGAPHFLAFFSEPKDGCHANAGFMMQQMDLWFSSKEIGSCWQGGPKVTGSVVAPSGMEYVTMLAFGRPGEDVHRRSVAEFKRDPLAKMSKVVGADGIMESARLAPSGMNNQPWLFTGDAARVNAFADKSMVVGRMNQVSTGIALCHLWLAAEHAGRKTAMLRDPSAKSNEPRGFAYVASLLMA
ncbi:MAG TPA: nitroreductase family protein [Methanomassiliicoccales archaeon]|nr:nitroreductase family protein [Methanomassiliicoccales archaeon]